MHHKSVRGGGGIGIGLARAGATAAFLIGGPLVVAWKAAATPVTWDGSSGLLPWDPAVPAARRFTVQFPGPPGTTAVVAGGLLRIRDTSAGSSVDASRLLSITAADDWVVQESVRVTGLSRPGLAFGPSFAIQDTTHQAFVAIAKDRVGILTFGGAGWVDNVTYALDTASPSHLYRLTRSGPTVSLYAEDLAVPKLSIPYADLGAGGARSSVPDQHEQLRHRGVRRGQLRVRPGDDRAAGAGGRRGGRPGGVIHDGRAAAGSSRLGLTIPKAARDRRHVAPRAGSGTTSTRGRPAGPLSLHSPARRRRGRARPPFAHGGAETAPRPCRNVVSP